MEPICSCPLSVIVLPSKCQFHIRTWMHSSYVLHYQDLCSTMKVCYCVQEPPTQEEKDCYLKKAAEFAASLAASLEDPDACRLYCPAFKSSACQCLQKYITENGNEVFCMWDIRLLQQWLWKILSSGLWHLRVLLKLYYITWCIMENCSFFIFIFITVQYSSN